MLFEGNKTDGLTEALVKSLYQVNLDFSGSNPPPSFVFVVDNDGDYLIDNDGDYMVAPTP